MSGQETGAPAPAVEMPLDECHAVLREARVGMLAMVSEDGPYAIPMAYGWDGGELWVGVSEGLKTRLLDADARCAFTVWVADGRERWRSVIVAGRAHWAATPEERMRAGQALRRQHGGGTAEQPQATRTSRFSGGRLLLVRDARITGRAKR